MDRMVRNYSKCARLAETFWRLDAPSPAGQLLRSGMRHGSASNLATQTLTRTRLQNKHFSSHSHPYPHGYPHSWQKPRQKRPQFLSSRYQQSRVFARPRSSQAGASKVPLSMSQRFRKLSREYGWSAFGVYMLLSALDFPFCFMAVRALGVERIGHAEKVLVEYFEALIPEAVKSSYSSAKSSLRMMSGSYQSAHSSDGTPRNDDLGSKAVESYASAPSTGVSEAVLPISEYDHGVTQAEADNKGDNASIWTQLALAYAIHKSFIFVRIPLTIAVTPRVVKQLRGWGWNIGRRKS